MFPPTPLLLPPTPLLLPPTPLLLPPTPLLLPPTPLLLPPAPAWFPLELFGNASSWLTSQPAMSTTANPRIPKYFMSPPGDLIAMEASQAS